MRVLHFLCVAGLMLAFGLPQVDAQEKAEKKQENIMLGWIEKESAETLLSKLAIREVGSTS